MAYGADNDASEASQGLLILPSDGATIPPVPVYFKWNKISGAYRYAIQVSTHPSFDDRFIVFNRNLTPYKTDYKAYDLQPGNTYYWRIRAQYNDESWNDWCQAWHFNTIAPTDVEDDDHSGFPEHPELYQNFPNPFNPTTTIDYNLARSSHVSLTLYDILGRRIRQLIDTEQSSGSQSAIWDGTDDDGNPVAGGIYFYRLRAGDFGETKKMLLLK